MKAHNSKPDGKPNGKNMKCTYCHNAEEGGIKKKKAQLLKKGESNYSKTLANPICSTCHK
jgi:molybdenum cofactor biosynthesis enzyme MoaA